MGASTLYTLLVKLGFDMSSLKTGSKDAQVELNAIGTAAKLAAANGAPAAAALNNLAKAAQAVQGSSGASTVLRNLADTSRNVMDSTKGSANALNSVASAAARVAVATGNGSVLNNYARGVSAISEATNGSVAAITNFTKGVTNTIATTGGAIAPLNRFMISTVDAAKGASDVASAIEAVAIAAKGSAPALVDVAGASAAAAADAQDALAESANSAAPKIQRVATATAGAAGEMDKMTSSAMRSSQAVKEIGEAANTTSERAGFLQRTLSMAFAFGGGVAVTTAIGFIGNALLGFNSRLQQAHIAFTTLLGSGGDADKFIKQMEDFANVTPFDFQGVQDATQRLMAMGFTADQVLPTLRAVGDAVAGLGGSKDTLDRVTLALGQMRTAAHLNAQDMRQLTEAGIPAWQYLADAIHKTVGETVKMGQAGKISTAEAIPAILTGMNKQFGGLMAEQARTAQGAFSTIRDAALQTISTAIQPLFDVLTSGMVMIADFFVAGGGKYIIPFIYAIGAAIVAFLIPRLIGLIGTLVAVKVELLGMTVPLLPLIIAITALGIAWQENFGGIRTTLEPAVRAIMGFAAAILQAVASSGLLIPVLEVVVTLLVSRWIVALTISGAQMLWNAAAAVVMAGAMDGLAVSEGAAAAASTGLIARLGAVVALLGGPVTLTIGLVVAAVVLLTTNFERVGQGVRVLEYVFVGAIKGIIDAASSIPFIGDQFKGLSKGLQDDLNGISKDAADAEARINAAVAAANQAPSTAAGLALPGEFQKLVDSFKSGSSDVLDTTTSLVDQFGYLMKSVVEAAGKAGGDAMEQMAKDIKAHQDAPLNAIKTLHDMLRAQLSPATEMARLMAEMQMPDIAEGMASQDAAVRAQTQATVDYITGRLDELSGGAYTAGQNAIKALNAGEKSVLDTMPHYTAGGAELYGPFLTTPQKAKDAWDAVAPSVSSVDAQIKLLNDDLAKTQNYNQGLSALNTAFSEIQSAAHKFFDAEHQGNLQAIDDALKHKNALLDAKEALNQAPVTAAQKALDMQRKAIEEWRLRLAVSQATTPEQYRDAVLALRDFLAQKHIDEMQAQVDSSKAVIDAQKQRNDDLAAAEKAAENRRYDMQSQAFDRQLELLRRYLAKHPEEWAKTNSKVLALLASYGISYQTAGSSLGEYFVIGLKEKLADAVAAVKLMADLIPGLDTALLGLIKGQYPGSGAGYGNTGTVPGSTVKPTSGGTTGKGGALPLASGMWEVLQNNLLALLHMGEMVVPRDASNLLRSLSSQRLPSASMNAFSAMPSSALAGTGNGGTIIFQVGNEVLAEATDRNLKVQGDVFTSRRTVKVRSSR